MKYRVILFLLAIFIVIPGFMVAAAPEKTEATFAVH